MAQPRPTSRRPLALTLTLWACAATMASAVPHGHPATALGDQHSAEVAACRRRGNLYAFYRPLGRCMALLDEVASPCAQPGALLVLNATSLEACCLALPCAPCEVLLPDGRCHAKRDVCAGRDDMELVLRETGYGACDCRDGHVFWRADGRCYAALTRGPCARGEHVVWSERGVHCEPAPCPAEQVPWQGQCVPREGHGCLDSVHGHLRLNPATLRYQCTLRCPDAMVEVGLDCHALYARGPCAFGEFVEPVRGTRYGRCAPNPCERDGLLPWAGRCWRAGEPCAAEDDDDWEEAPTTPPAGTRTTRAPPPLVITAYSDMRRPAAAAIAAPERAQTTPAAARQQAVKRTTAAAAAERTPSAAPVDDSAPPPTQTPATETASTTTGAPAAASSTRSSLPLHLQYLLGNAPKLDHLPFLRNRWLPRPLLAPPPPMRRARPPSLAVSEALVARRSLVPPPPPASASGLLELLGLPAFHGQASEPSVSSIPAPMLRPVQYTYDGKAIRNPLFRDRRRRAVSAAVATAMAAPRIIVHPATRQVTCSDDALLAAPESFAHYKCRPGSRRDTLGECHHGGAAWTDLHPRRCPYGMRHNRLTGQCKPAA